MQDSNEKSVRLGYGEFAAPGERSLALWDARGAFLWRVERLAGIVLEDLRKNVFPVYMPPPGWKAGEDVDPETVVKHKEFIIGRWSDVHQETRRCRLLETEMSAGGPSARLTGSPFL